MSSASIVTVSEPRGEASAAPSAQQPRDNPRGLLGDAWYDLRRKPLFWISATLITLFMLMAAFPSLLTSADPTSGTMGRSLRTPSVDGWFGYDIQGRDIYARTIYGARASIVVAVTATLGTVLLGSLIGVVAGFRGGWADSLLSRLGDIFFGVPFILGAIVVLFSLNPGGAGTNQWKIIGLVILALIMLQWPVSMRVMRSSVLSTKQADYVTAARALGASNARIVRKHLVPNCLAPTLVYATILAGAFISSEAVLSYLGVGLQSPVVSWGVMINDSQDLFRHRPHVLLFPAGFLIVAVLSFVMLGEAIREALDPKLR